MELEDITVQEADEVLVAVADTVEVVQVVVTKVVALLVEDTREADRAKEVLSVHDMETIVLLALQAEDIRVENEALVVTRGIVPRVVLHTEAIVHAQLVGTRPQKDHLVVTKGIALLEDTRVVNVLLVAEVTKEVVLSLTGFEAELIHLVISDSIRVPQKLPLLDTREIETSLALNVQNLEVEIERIVEATRNERTKLLETETMLEEPRKLGQAVRKVTSNNKTPCESQGVLLYLYSGLWHTTSILWLLRSMTNAP